MSELTKGELLAAFCALAEKASPNTPQTLQAQYFFKKNIMGTTEEDAKNAHLQKSALSRAYVDAVADLVNHVTQCELYSTQNYEALKARLPCQHTNTSRGIGHVLHRLEGQFGMREPVMGHGK